MKKISQNILILAFLIWVFIPFASVNAQTSLPSRPTTCSAVDSKGNCLNDSTYTLLAPLPCDSNDPACNHGQLTTYNPTDNNNIGGYLNLMIKIFIGICAVLAVIMIVMGGVEYMTSELVGTVEHGRNQIVHAVFGLILALAAWTIINQINPDILNTDLKTLTTQEVTVDLGNDIPQTAVGGKYTDKFGSYAVGVDWAAIAGAYSPALPAGVTVKQPECLKVGDTNCTSIRALDPSAINSVAQQCNISASNPVVITGGTEFWLHSTTTSHGRNSSTVDIRSTPSLDQCLSGGKGLVNMTRYPSPSGPLYETDGGAHWHIGS